VGINRFSGTIPPPIFNMSSLIFFSVGVNQIQGHLPSDIGITLPNIQFFSIGGNKFTGSIPGSISNASNLEIFQLPQNKLSGKVPSLEKLNRIFLFFIAGSNLGYGRANDLSFLCSFKNATYLNNLGGELPRCIGNFSTTLVMLLLDNNKISGKIPNEIGNLINLGVLIMAQNKLSGNIPTEIGKLQKLQMLELNTNNFYGNIPSSIGNLSVLRKLHLYENNLQGNIPLSLLKCRNLFNNLSGSISPQVIGLSFSLTFLDLSANQFTGVLPMEVGNFINLEYLDISENMLFGKIPTSLSSCIKLEFLAMRRNLI
jgi:Leucine-rich repeat (LRR) protein